MSSSILQSTAGRSTGKKSSPWFLVVFGIIGLGISFYSYQRQAKFLETAMETTGVVQEIVRTTQTSRRDGVRTREYEFHPIVEFSVEGQSSTFRGPGSKRGSGYRIGEEVPVLYNPADLKDAQIKKKNPQMTAYLSGGIGTAALIAGIFMVIKKRKNKQET